MPRILSVHELTRAIKDILTAEFPFVWVRGQVSNYSRASSGHVYFSLKDDQAVLNVVWFKSHQGRAAENNGVDPLTGEVLEDSFVLADGMDVLCAGHLNVYGQRGVYQLVAELVQEQGTGRLQLLFEELKQRLLQQGLFDQEKKRELPKNPVRVAVVTAAGSAALRDFLKRAHERGVAGQVRIYPSLVQGKEAPAQVCAALQQAASDGWAQAVALIRGGGSLEDLWAFNEEAVVRQVADCPVPVVTGIGHEVDTSLADLAADARAATPTHAAQLLWPQREGLLQNLDELEARLTGFMRRYLERQEQELARCRQTLVWFSPQKQIGRAEEKHRDFQLRLKQGMSRFLSEQQKELESLRGRVCTPVKNILGIKKFILDMARTNCIQAMQNSLQQKSERSAVLMERFLGLDPQKALRRGFCRLENSKGRTVSRVRDVKSGEVVSICMQDGMIGAQVKEVRPESVGEKR